MIFKDIDIDNLFKLMEQHDVAEVTLRDGKIEVEVKRKHEPVVMSPGTVIAGSMESINGVQEVRTAEAAAPEVPNKAADPSPPVEKTAADDYHSIEAPLVGTFYRSPSPDSDPFVEVGTKVKKGQTLCIVEAMKSMNEIPSDVSGIVREICVENSDMVEFEQVLFKIETKG
jgi:acetyl-CoA carboxylase biotin carboxyl carrier protein